MANAMDIWRPLRFLILFLLVSYFISKLIDSSRRLHEAEIGLSFKKIREDLVEGSYPFNCNF